MDRLEYIRGLVDKEIASIQSAEERKFAYIHTYGVAQGAALLAIVRNVDVEIACIAAMLHDISLYALNSPHRNHALKSGEYAKKLLIESNLFNDEEINIIEHVIVAHSDKMNRQDGKITELLKDADVLQHYLYNINIPLSEKDKFRLFYLLEDLKKQTP